MIGQKSANPATIWMVRALSLAGCAALLVGLVFTPIRLGLPSVVTRHDLTILGLIAVIALVLGQLARWTMASALVLVGALLLVRFVGAGPLLVDVHPKLSHFPG